MTNPLEQATKSKTFCVLPWIQQYIGPAGDVKPCCIYQHSAELGNLSNNTLEEIWNNDASKDIRVKMLAGEVVLDCGKCNLREGLETGRKNYNRSHFKRPYVIDSILSTQPDGTVPEHNLYYMDVRFNNLCNFSCRTCGPYFSTSWIADYIKLHSKLNGIELSQSKKLLSDKVFHYPGNSEDHAFNEIEPHLQTVKDVYFAGGEPLMQIQHYQILEKLIQIGNLDVGILYNTNLSILKLQGHNVIDYWNKFKTPIRVNASIDGSYERAEYWRRGTVWENLVSNAKTIKKSAPSVVLSISYTLSWPNAINMVQLHKEWVELEIIKPEDFSINLLDAPAEYSLQNIPDWKKQQIEEIYREHMSWLKEQEGDVEYSISQYENAIKFMNQHQRDVHESLITFSKKTTALDEIRNENFYDVFPEHEDMREYIRNL